MRGTRTIQLANVPTAHSPQPTLRLRHDSPAAGRRDEASGPIESRVALTEDVQAQLVIDLSAITEDVRAMREEMHELRRQNAAQQREIAALRAAVPRDIAQRVSTLEYDSSEARLAHGAELQVQEYMNHYRENDEAFGKPKLRYTHR